MRRVLVTGAAGLLGAAIVEEFRREWDVVAATHARLDITDEPAVRALVDDVRPAVILNCAAYNDVDGAEGDAATALNVNALGVRALARAARSHAALLVHYSTDFIFDGETTRPYVEEDAPSPQSTYGASKLLAEWFAADAPAHYVLRVESLFGGPAAATARRGSLAAIVDRLRAGDIVPVFVDRTISPAYTPDVASATRTLVERALPAGTYHCVNDGCGTWLQIAQQAAQLLGVTLRARELTLATFTGAALRPRYCALSPARLASLGVVMPPWQDALARYLQS